MSWLLLKILSWLPEILYDLFVELFGSYLDRKLPTYLTSNFFKSSKSAYKKNLIDIANVMPFLYKDLKVEVLNDFANIEVERITIDTKNFEEKSFFNNSLNSMLKDAKRVIFLGNAGIGKTTFQRHSILKILTNKKEVDFLYPQENPLPFYIPLKAVDDSRRFPILNYILNNQTLFSETRSKSLKQLLKIVKNQGIFLFIDGYDEIQFLGGNTNFVKNELNLIFTSKHFTPITQIPKKPTEKDFYESIPSCRVWLSSRKEFYKLYPLQLERRVETRGLNVVAVAIRGIYENRYQLILNIFKKYPDHKHLLSAKFFLKEIDNADDKGMIDLSYNPLFLTIMSYVYVRKVIDKKDYKVKSAKNYYDLITECIDLLLIDLDKHKAIGLNEPDKEAELNIRNAYVLEKKEFLPYFATELFFDSKPVFDIHYLNKKVVRFFELNPNFDKSVEIIKRLLNDPYNKINFSYQLILQGLFVLIDKQNHIDLYDFPHKRFREVLAIQYFEKFGYDLLIENADKENLSELWVAIFQISKQRENLFYALLKYSKISTKPDYVSKLLINCLKQVSPNFPSSRILEKFITHCIESNSSFNLSSDLLEVCGFQFSKFFSEYIHRKFYESLENKHLFSMSICCFFILKFNEPLMEELSEKVFLPLLEEKNDFANQIILTYPKIAKFINQSIQTNDFTKYLIYISGLYSDILSKIPENELFQKNHFSEDCFIVTEIIVNNLKTPEKVEEVQQTEFNKFKTRIKGKVFFDVSFLDNLPYPWSVESRKIILEKSRINYLIYEEIVKLLLEYYKKTEKKMKIFNDW